MCDRAPNFSPDGSKIVFFLYQAHLNKPGQIWVIDADGGNRKMLNNWGYRPAWSPDGKRIAFMSNKDCWAAWESADIYVMDADGKNVKILTDIGPSWDDYCSWSPDGTKIVFCSDRDGNFEIYVMNADGSNVQRLTNTPANNELEPDWTASTYAVEPAGKLKSTWGEIKALIRPH